MIWVLCTLLLAAVIVPWIYQGGKWLANLTASREMSGVIEWLGAACGRSKFNRFFDRSLLLSALVLLPFLLRHVRRQRSEKADDPSIMLRPVGGSSALCQALAGAAIAGGVLWLLALLLVWIGAYEPKLSIPSFSKILIKSAPAAVIVAFLEEWLFRGVLLDLWLRYTKPAFAVIGISLLFAFLHFLKPPDGVVIADPTSVFSGFELLGKILLHFTDPLFFVTDFSTLVVVGLILAWARVRTGALWFSIGLHAGLVIAFKAVNMTYQKFSEHPVFPWGVGDNLRSGVLPILALGLIAWLCTYVLPKFANVNRASL